MTGDTPPPVTTITSDPVTAVTDRKAPKEETSHHDNGPPQGGETAREVEQVADKEISPRQPAKDREQKSDDKAATRVSRVKRVKRMKRVKR